MAEQRPRQERRSSNGSGDGQGHGLGGGCGGEKDNRKVIGPAGVAIPWKFVQ